MTNPTELYTTRLRQREAQLTIFDRAHDRIGSVRLGIGALFLATAGFCLHRDGAWGWLVLPGAAFVAAVLYHQRLQSRRGRALRSVQFYRRGLERMRGHWTGPARPRAPSVLRQHEYGDDLDLFGAGGLFSLLCTARTLMGESLLARWLLEPASLEVIRQRQAALDDLAGRHDFREDLAVSGASALIDLQPDVILDWTGARRELDARGLQGLAVLLALCAIGGAVVWSIWDTAAPLLAVLALELGVTAALRGRVTRAISAVENAHEDIRLLAALVERIEGEGFDSPLLATLRAKLTDGARPASVALQKLATLVNLVESRRNPLLVPLLLPLMVPLQVGLAAERWRASHGATLAACLDTVAQIEALIALATYRFEHPSDPFPEFIDGAATFRAVGLGHPLIDPGTRVRNDVDLSGATRVLLVSGSNMSGKSTLLRAAGINTVLAMAGAPVCAQRLELTPLQVGASIRVNDSLQEGASRFYAEIKRLRQLFEPAPFPLLFLLDELLQGTNSSDRRIGAQGVVRALIERGGIGLISTHDLALTDIQGLQPAALKNVHFQDELRDGRLEFDFKLREGIVTKSNGIELMRSIGLDV